MQARRKKSKKKLAHSQSPARRGRIRLAVVGAGRLGVALGRALGRSAYEVEVVVTKRAHTAQKAARLVGSGVLSLTAGQLGRLTDAELGRLNSCELIVIATPDDDIRQAAVQLSSLFKAGPPRGRRQRVALHTSGALSSETLEPLRGAGFAIGSLHPLVSISDPLSGANLQGQAFFCVEGDRAAVLRARSIVRDLNGQSFTIDAHWKALYHAAAVSASGHLVALVDIAMEMLGRCGLSAGRAQEVLLPLVKSTVSNLSSKTPTQALTGTFARGDLSTVRRHFAAIESAKLADARAAYLLLGKRSIDLARKAGASQIELAEIEELIREAANRR